MKPWFVLALSAALFWGAYVPAISFGQAAFGMANPNKSMRAFLFIGLAYFFMAIVIPGIWVQTHPSPADAGFTMRGGVLSTLAGALGALGALGVVFSLRAAGPANAAVYVAPVVFCGAPIVNVLISYLIEAFKGAAQVPDWRFFLGLLLAVTGVTFVLLFSPAGHAPPKPAALPAAPSAMSPPLSEPRP